MKKTKTQKGITLIALIITIIVLLILAVVAISAVQDGGIIQYAKNARSDYGEAQVNENTTLDNYIAYLDEHTQNGGSSTEGEGGADGEGATGGEEEPTEIVPEIGEYVAYTPAGEGVTVEVSAKSGGAQTEEVVTTTKTLTMESTLQWRYMGKDSSGNYLLVSDVPTTQETVFGHKELAFDDWSGTPSDVDENLNDVCNQLYGSIVGNARNMNANDVNRLIGADFSGDDWFTNFPSGSDYTNTSDVEYQLVFAGDYLLSCYHSWWDEWGSFEYKALARVYGTGSFGVGYIHDEYMGPTKIITGHLRPVIEISSESWVFENNNGWYLNSGEE